MTQELQKLAEEADAAMTYEWEWIEFKQACTPDAILELLDRLEKAEKDAARYRWWTEVIESGELERLEKAFEPLGDADTTTKKEIDAVLDAAMEASK